MREFCGEFFRLSKDFEDTYLAAAMDAAGSLSLFRSDFSWGRTEVLWVHPMWKVVAPGKRNGGALEESRLTLFLSSEGCELYPLQLRILSGDIIEV